MSLKKENIIQRHFQDISWVHFLDVFVQRIVSFGFPIHGKYYHTIPLVNLSGKEKYYLLFPHEV